MTDEVSIFTVRSWEQLRALLYVVTPLVISATVPTHTHEWVGLALAVLAPSLAAIKSVNGFRTWFYGVLAAVQSLLVSLNIVTEAQISPWLMVIGALIGGSVAASHVREQ